MNDPWNQITSPENDVLARRVDHAHPLDFFWAKDHFGRYLFIYEFSCTDTIKKIDLPILTGIQVAILPGNAGHVKHRLILILNERGNWELFLSLCHDLILVTRQSLNALSAVQTILRRLHRWQEFLKKAQTGILPEERIKGLIGELLFLRNHLTPVFGARDGVKFWQGPEGFPQDFNVNSSAIEVKCQSGADTSSLSISSADQLCPQLPEMYLYVVILGKATLQDYDVLNLPALVSDIRNLLSIDASNEVERFNDLLHMIGYSDSDQYLDFCYVFIDESVYHVTSGFPRICSTDLHPGVIRLSYHISLAACEPFKGRPDWLGATR